MTSPALAASVRHVDALAASIGPKLIPLHGQDDARGRGANDSPDMDGRTELPEPAEGWRRAAVLVPILSTGTPRVLFTIRHNRLSRHAGQISFPGGRIDDGDASPLAAALRETAEEIGLASSGIRPLGYLEDCRTGTGYAIAPVVALIDPLLPLSLCADEVVAVFEVPLSRIMDQGSYELRDMLVRGANRRFYAITHGEHLIWGATAAILKSLSERLSRS